MSYLEESRTSDNRSSMTSRSLGRIRSMLNRAKDNLTVLKNGVRDRTSSVSSPAPHSSRTLQKNFSVFEGYVDADRSFEKYDFGQEIGRGAFGRVVKATDKESGKEFACKILPITALTSNQDIANIESLLNEAEILLHVRGHPNILKINAFFEHNGELYVLQELCLGGDLVEAVLEDSLTEGTVAKIMQRILESLAHCHALGVIHRDIKLDNFLLSKNGPDLAENLRLADFGCSKFTHETELLKEAVGTIEYMAPEVFEGAANYPSDVWSCGVIMYSMLSGRFPFPVYPDIKQTYMTVKQGKIDLCTGHWQHVSHEAKDCLSALLAKDPEKRPTAAQAIEMEWFKLEGAARDKPLERPVRIRLKEFAAMNRFKQECMRIVAVLMDEGSRAGFRKMFENASGGQHKISEEAALNSLRERNMPEEEIEYCKPYLRYDSEGYMHLDEYIALVAASTTGIKTAGMLEQVYKILDVDEEGFISARGIKKGFHMADTAEVEKILKEAGAKNGKLTEEAFYKVMLGPEGCLCKSKSIYKQSRTSSPSVDRDMVTQRLAQGFNTGCSIM